MNHDWNAALLQFRAALKYEPGNAGIRRLIDLADYATKRAKQLSNKPVADKLAQDDAAAMKLLDQQIEVHLTDLALKYLDQEKDAQTKVAK